MAKSFSATVSERVRTYQRRMEETFRASAQDVYKEVTRPVAKGGNMRIKTGFLRASLMASTSSMPSIQPNARPPDDAGDDSYRPNDGEVALTIAKAQLGQTIYLGFTASYAPYREALDGFVRLAAQNWPQIVAKNAALAMAKYR